MENTECTYKQGALPACSPLGLASMPMQGSSQPAYSNEEALSRGTLFPGLDLPFMNIVNKMPANTTPLRELMALDLSATSSRSTLTLTRTTRRPLKPIRAC